MNLLAVKVATTTAIREDLSLLRQACQHRLLRPEKLQAHSRFEDGLKLTRIPRSMHHPGEDSHRSLGTTDLKLDDGVGRQGLTGGNEQATA
jgi:hypothetical protein